MATPSRRLHHRTATATATTPTRKTRIVCISDTHNQTPKLPHGNVLIHAGDLTNQGSYSELKRTVEWLEKANFEKVIVVAGNHDITLDEAFFKENHKRWKWPGEQDTRACRKLLVESKSVTYLENDVATIRLSSGVQFTVFGSPCTSRVGHWAFQYSPDEAKGVWGRIPEGVDVVVTHTPPKNVCDGTARGLKDGKEGCPALLRRLEQVRPMLSICGHIHAGRGVERVHWNTGPSNNANANPIDSVEFWNDPGGCSKKLSLVDLTSKSGRSLGCGNAALTRQWEPDSLRDLVGGQPDAHLSRPHEGPGQPRSGDEKLIPTTSLTNVARLEKKRNEALWGGGGRGRGGGFGQKEGDVGHGCPDEATQVMEESRRGMPCTEAVVARRESVVINAAYLGPRIAGKSTSFNKAIVVDVELPVWVSETEDEGS